MKPEKQTFLKLCLTALLLLVALFGVWRVWDVRYKSIDTVDDGQMTASLLPLQNPTLISGEHGYWPDIQEVSVSKNDAKKKETEKSRYSEDVRSPDSFLREPVLSSASTINSSDDQWFPPLCKGVKEVEIEGKKIIMYLDSKPVRRD